MQNKITAQDLWDDVLEVRSRAPLVHNITNFVVMNFNANVLLALGASPIMAHAHEEVEEMIGIAQALVLNIGTLEPVWIDSMILAKKRATEKGIPIILDPVGAGATSYRDESITKLLAKKPPQIIRGNASEIMSVVGQSVDSKGVDSTASSAEAIEAAFKLARHIQGVVCVSGETDHVVNAQGQHVSLSNGQPLMAKVTGVGCSATAMIGAFAAIQPAPFRATAACMAYLGVAGEIAAQQTLEKGAGPGTFQVELLDAINLMSKEQFLNLLKMKRVA